MGANAEWGIHPVGEPIIGPDCRFGVNDGLRINRKPRRGGDVALSAISSISFRQLCRRRRGGNRRQQYDRKFINQNSMCGGRSMAHCASAPNGWSMKKYQLPSAPFRCTSMP